MAASICPGNRTDKFDHPCHYINIFNVQNVPNWWISISLLPGKHVMQYMLEIIEKHEDAPDHEIQLVKDLCQHVRIRYLMAYGKQTVICAENENQVKIIYYIIDAVNNKRENIHSFEHLYSRLTATSNGITRVTPKNPVPWLMCRALPKNVLQTDGVHCYAAAVIGCLVMADKFIIKQHSDNVFTCAQMYMFGRSYAAKGHWHTDGTWHSKYSRGMINADYLRCSSNIDYAPSATKYLQELDNLLNTKGMDPSVFLEMLVKKYSIDKSLLTIVTDSSSGKSITKNRPAIIAYFRDYLDGVKMPDSVPGYYHYASILHKKGHVIMEINCGDTNYRYDPDASDTSGMEIMYAFYTR